MSHTSEQVARPFAFTHRWYVDFLADLQTAGYAFESFGGDLDAGSVVVRHDVDLSVDAAVRMARLEASVGVESTYFLFASSPLYNPQRRRVREAVAEIRSLGHDVGLHFDPHEHWDDAEPPDEAALLERIEAELDVLETLGERPTAVSFHRPPSWALGRSFDAFENAYAPRYFEDAEYVSDSSQRWRSDPPTVDDLGDTVQVLSHPGLWGANDASFEECVREHVDSACASTRRKAERDFLDGGP